MNEIKSYLLNFIWEGKNSQDFEKWLYNQESGKFEKLLGEENYVELISYDIRNKTIEQIKRHIKQVFPKILINEFETSFKEKEKMIKGVCIKNEALNYGGKDIRNWDVTVGETYEFLIINTGLKKGNHFALANYSDRENNFRPSGYIPMELFDIELNNISDLYHRIVNAKKEMTIEPKSWSEKVYVPIISFWEDFYDDVENAVNTYYDTIEKLGIKNVW